MKNKHPLVSIVIPIYNGEKYLPGIIKNLAEQTYKNIEVLLVDDFSTDNSVKIIEEMTRGDKRFKLLKRETKGGTAVAGQEYALPFVSGDYYFYMSQDDFIDNDLLEKCIERAIDTDADVVMPNMVFYYENQHNTKAFLYPLNNDYSSELEPKTAFELSLTWQIHGSVLRKMSLVKKVGIKADYYNSCEYYLRKSFLYANKIVFADSTFYYRQDNPNAITKSIKYFTVDIMTTDLMLIDLAIQNNCSREIICHQIHKLRRNLISWTRKRSKYKWTPEQKKYVKTACRNAYNVLRNLSKQYKIFNNPIRFWISGIRSL